MYVVEKQVIIGSSHKIHACHSLTHYITEYKTVLSTASVARWLDCINQI